VHEAASWLSSFKVVTTCHYPAFTFPRLPLSRLALIAAGSPVGITSTEREGVCHGARPDVRRTVDFTPSFRLTLAAKDARLVTESARQHGLDLPLLDVVARRLREGTPEHGDKDFSATYLTNRTAQANRTAEVK
jgi:NAD-binding of NADP-dependent 3-hydroxyisobutyrate dehydrogenase